MYTKYDKVINQKSLIFVLKSITQSLYDCNYQPKNHQGNNRKLSL